MPIASACFTANNLAKILAYVCKSVSGVSRPSRGGSVRNFLCHRGLSPPDLGQLAWRTLSATTDLSATLPAQAGPRGFPVGACAPPAGLPVLPLLPSYAHAAVTTPAETGGVRVARFPTAGCLPRILGGSASALLFSRPAQRSLLVAACALAEPPKATL